MKKYMLAAALAALATPAFATCPYPLDATAAQYAQTPYTPFPTITYQSAEYLAAPTDTGGYLSVVNYGAFSAAGLAAAIQAGGLQPAGDVTLPASGIIAFEFNVDHFPATADTTSNVYIGGGFFSGNDLLNPSSGDGISFDLVFAASGWGSLTGVVAASRNNGVITWAAGPVTPLVLPLPANTRVGIYINLNTRQVGYTINGTDFGYLQAEGGGAFTIPATVTSVALALNGIMQVESGSPQIGQPVGATLVTDRAAFTQPFPAGTTDICTTSGPGTGLRLPNGKPFPGKATPPGLQKFQALPLPVKPLGLAIKP